MRALSLISSLLILTFTSVAQTGGDLGAILDSEGKIRAGINGSFDAAGYSVTTDRAGRLRFAQSQQPNGTESIAFSAIGNTYGVTGSNQSTAQCVLVQGSDIYLSGWITVAGNVVANGIVKWNGTQWVSLGAGFNGNVLAMIFIGTELYAAGNFTRSGGLTVNSVAKWDGSEWSDVGGGVNSSINSLCTDGTNLYAGGSFTLAGSTSAHYIAKWDGSAWSALGTGMNSTVQSVYFAGGNLYAGGNFTTAGGASAKRVALWNGTNWAELGTGVLGSSAYVLDIHLFGGVVYIGGYFTSIDGNIASYIMGWNGSNWTALGTGLNAQPYSFVSDGAFLYVGGAFLTAGGASSPYVAKWDGSAWTSLGSGISGQVDGMAMLDGTLYLAGQFTQKFAKWNGTFSFDPAPGTDVVTNGLSVAAVCVNGNDIYIGGYFSSAGGVTVNNIAKWNGSTWQNLGSGVTGGFSPAPVQALAHDGTYLYAGGYFTNAGGSSISYLAKWDGSSWSAVGGTPNGPVWDIEVANGKLYIGGSFTSVNSVLANRIAEYSAGSWNALGTGFNNLCYDLTLDGTTIYATGLFTTAGGNSASYVAKWDGSVWIALGSGLSAVGKAIKFHNSNVYVAGNFTAAGGVAANRAAIWNGSGWSNMGTGFPTAPETIEAYGSDIYFGGSFYSAGSTTSANLAKWNGSDWVAIGSGTDAIVRALSVQTSTGSMIFGGDFLVSNGNTYTQRIAKFTDSDNPLPVELVSFSGRLDGNSIQLNWQTATEIDNNGFAIEQKKQNSDWQKIGFVEGHGASNSPKYYSFIDHAVSAGSKYSYRLKQIDGDGTFTYSNTIELTTSGITDFTLEQNYPNPFNPETVIRFALPVAGDIRLDIFNSAGERIVTLAEGPREEGVHSVKFSADGLASGIYFYTLEAGGKKLTGKMMLLR